MDNIVIRLPGWLGLLLFIDAVAVRAAYELLVLHDGAIPIVNVALECGRALAVAVLGIATVWLAVYCILFICRRDLARAGLLHASVIGTVLVWPSLYMLMLH